MVSETMSPPAETPEEVLALLGEQASLYAELETYASRQRRLVTEEDTGPLLSLLLERQKLSAALTRMADRLEPIRRDWTVHRQRLSGRQRAQADHLLTEIQERLRRVIERDEEDARLLAARKQKAAEALRTTHATGEALSAYRAPTPGHGRRDHLDETR